MNPMDLYERGTAWTKEKIAGGRDQLDAQTPCDKWTVRALINHLLEGQEFFQASARGEKGTLTPEQPPDMLDGDDPVEKFEKARKDDARRSRRVCFRDGERPLHGREPQGHLRTGSECSEGRVRAGEASRLQRPQTLGG